jgi:hypothetical protein
VTTALVIAVAVVLLAGLANPPAGRRSEARGNGTSDPVARGSGLRPLDREWRCAVRESALGGVGRVDASDGGHSFMTTPSTYA